MYRKLNLMHFALLRQVCRKMNVTRQALTRPLTFVSVLETLSIKFEFELSLTAVNMAADPTVPGVPPSLSAKVVGYVDSSFNYFVTMLNIVGNYTGVLKQHRFNLKTVVFNQQ